MINKIHKMSSHCVSSTQSSLFLIFLDCCSVHLYFYDFNDNLKSVFATVSLCNVNRRSNPVKRFLFVASFYLSWSRPTPHTRMLLIGCEWSKLRSSGSTRVSVRSWSTKSIPLPCETNKQEHTEALQLYSLVFRTASELMFSFSLEACGGKLLLWTVLLVQCCCVLNWCSL